MPSQELLVGLGFLASPPGMSPLSYFFTFIVRPHSSSWPSRTLGSSLQDAWNSTEEKGKTAFLRRCGLKVELCLRPPAPKPLLTGSSFPQLQRDTVLQLRVRTPLTTTLKYLLLRELYSLPPGLQTFIQSQNDSRFQGGLIPLSSC